MAEKKFNNVYGPKKITPKGVLVYPHLNKPDTYEGKTQYKTKIRVAADDSDMAAFIVTCDEFAKDATEKCGKKLSKRPWIIEDETGDYILSAHSNLDNKPVLKDTQKNIISDDTPVWGGSVARLRATIFGYTGLGGGVTLLLDSVCIYDLVTGANAGGEEFPDEEGYVTSTKDSSTDADGSDGEDLGDDDLPF